MVPKSTGGVATEIRFNIIENEHGNSSTGIYTFMCLLDHRFKRQSHCASTFQNTTIH